MVKVWQLFSFEFSTSQASLACPNCGHQIYNSIFTRDNVFNSFVIASCGTIFYLNYFKKDQFASFLLKAYDTFQYCTKSLLDNLTENPSQVTSKNYHFINQYNQSSVNNVHNQVLIANNFDTEYDESNEFSLNLSPLNSIGCSTIAKFDMLIDQVQQLKDCMDDSYSDLRCIDSSEQKILERRVSEGEMTLPSLEWDLGDIASDYDNSLLDGFSQKDFNFSSEVLDSEALAHIIFNKDFDFKEDRAFRLRKQFIGLKHRLKYRSRNFNNRQASQNLNSVNYRSNRDSAFFDDL